jgi:menaquinone-dependent protoporphyrinogen oxidase
MGKWLDETTDYIRRNEVELSARPTWLFASGPVGTESVDRKGHDLLAPPEFLRGAAADVLAEGIKVFFGRWDPSDPPLTFAERVFRVLPLPKDVMPIGDFRDWDEIDAWARSIARELPKVPVRAD